MGRGYSYSPSPPPRGGGGGGYGRRRRSPSPRGRYGGRSGGGGGGGSRDGPTSLLVRNLRRDCRPDDLRRQFGQFGRVKDVYLPRDYYSGEPRGFGFIQYDDPADAAEAKYQMDGQVFLGRELTVVFAEENRKKPSEMRARERRDGSSYDHRRSRSRSRSPRSPRNVGSHYRGRSYSPSPKKNYSRSVSPQDRKEETSYSPLL